MKNQSVSTPFGPLVLLNKESQEGVNTLFLGGGPDPSSLNGRKDSDLHLCLMALPVAESGGFGRFGVERQGCRTRYYDIAEVRKFGQATETDGTGIRAGNVEEGHPMGINIAPGAHFSILEHQRAVRRQASQLIVKP